ncbi:hypothetical protein BDP27DRAFT_1421077 [Rhodocollybia butyracea]|uniref:Uncharacterized protein n=1 Tax=Rhodocollybia butyracea TaxID=206335 RepID=A0A9P5PUB8_9AGAR|nr:hypothetical protein BDP27DRAFT_1421077 [Rhodocollybia butyracea]
MPLRNTPKIPSPLKGHRVMNHDTSYEQKIRPACTDPLIPNIPTREGPQTRPMTRTGQPWAQVYIQGPYLDPECSHIRREPAVVEILKLEDPPLSVPNELVLSPKILQSHIELASTTRIHEKSKNMRTTAFPSLLLCAVIAVATFTSILAAPAGADTYDYTQPVEIECDTANGMKHTFRGTNSPWGAGATVGIRTSTTFDIPDSTSTWTSGKFIKALPSNCQIEIIRADPAATAGIAKQYRMNKAQLGATITPPWGAFNRLRLFCYEMNVGGRRSTINPI